MPVALKAFVLTTVAMVAFAANSVIARMALVEGDIGQWSYTVLRLVSGAIVLAFIVGPKKSWLSGSWASALTLLMYAGFFSMAYLTLDAGLGALVLFTAVQLTMIGAGLLQGERLNALQVFGVTLAFAGLVILLQPGSSAPNVMGVILMAGSGIGWGLYSLRGRRAGDPTQSTSGNFLRAALIAVILAAPIFILRPENTPQTRGIMLAVLSGTVTSGLGYVIWYMAVKHLKAIQAGVAQLTVPAIAAVGGVLFLSEVLTMRFVFSSLIIFAGVVMVTLIPTKKRQRPH